MHNHTFNCFFEHIFRSTTQQNYLVYKQKVQKVQKNPQASYPARITLEVFIEVRIEPQPIYNPERACTILM